MITKIVKVSDKGQISLPVEIRKSAGITRGDSLLIIQSGDRLLMEKPKASEDFELLNSDEVAKEVWGNEQDEIWNDA